MLQLRIVNSKKGYRQDHGSQVAINLNTLNSPSKRLPQNSWFSVKANSLLAFKSYFMAKKIPRSVNGKWQNR
ncbi:27643_t:CDS:1, partial [Dentiscutata erythropus]